MIKKGIQCRCHHCKKLLFIAQVDILKPYLVTVGSRHLDRNQIEIKCNGCKTLNYVTVDDTKE